MNSLFEEDYFRYDQTYSKGIIKAIRIFQNRIILAQYLQRAVQKCEKKNAVQNWILGKSRRLFKKNGIEINDLRNVKGGLCLIHPYGITINSRARIGSNFTIFKGATIGSVRSGHNAGTPTIGDRVTVCSNAFVCGNIHIGDDVMIAANSFVNFDVPSNSVVIGNPGVIHAKSNPSADYLNS